VTTFTQGLTITAIGMGLVFLALGIVMLMMVLLQRIFSPAPGSNDALDSENMPTLPDAEAGRLAAIGAALALALAEESAAWSPAAASDGRHRGWAVLGRYRQLHAPRTREKRS
jgi:Na+-transporting methylmalonyl-CoA/oxaloacetate decarboxylase gamma subunit